MSGKTVEETVSMSWKRGFYPSSGDVGPESIPESVSDGANVLFTAPGIVRTAYGLGAGANGGVGGTRMYLADDRIAVVKGKGSVIPFRRSTYFAVADGDVYISSADGTSTQLIFPGGTGGKLQYYWNGIILNAGLAAPPKLLDPTRAGQSGAQYKIEVGNAGITNGTVSVQYTAYRTMTGEESNPSPPSDVVAFANKMVKLTLPSTPPSNDKDAYDAYKIYVTLPNQATTGTFFLLQTAMVGMGATTPVITFDYSGAGLIGQLSAPTDNFQPETGQYVAALGSYLLVIGTEGGTGINVSDGSNLGAYPPSSQTFLNPLEQVIGFAARAQESELVVWTMNSVQSFLLTSNAIQPIYPKAIWPSTGIQSPHGAVFVGSKIFGFNADSGAIILSNDSNPDMEFALPVRQYFKDNNWQAANVVVGYDPKNNCVVYMYGTTALCYMLDLGIWSPPITLNGSGGAVKACITWRGQLYVSMGDSLYGWENGTGLGAAFLMPNWNSMPVPGMAGTITSFRLNGKATQLKGELFTDFNTGSVPTNGTLIDNGTGKRYTQPQRVAAKCKAYTVKVTMQNPNEMLNSIDLTIRYNTGLRSRNHS